jgi:hypothetical protein
MVGFFPSILSISIPKFAVVSLLIRLLNPTRAHRIFLWVMVTVSGLILCGCMVILWAQCTPTRAQWDFSITEKKCWDIWILINYSRCASGETVHFPGSSFSCANTKKAVAGTADFYLAVYPACVLYSLHLNWKKKLALSCALGIGAV